MRISSGMLRNDALRSIGSNLEALARAQRESATGRRIQTVSDDPGGSAQVMRLDAHLRDIDQYRRNGTAAQTRLSTENAVLTSVRDLLDRARALALSGATQSPSDPLRQAALEEVDQIRNQLIELGNTKLGNEYLFGGAQTANPPFRLDGTYLGDDTVRRAEIDAGFQIDTNHTGNVMLGSALDALAGVATELSAGSPESIRARVDVLANAQQDVLAAQTQVGSRLHSIELTNQHLAARVVTFSDRRDAVRDVDPAEAALGLVATQNALERAYAAVGRVLSTNLLDFLK